MKYIDFSSLKFGKIFEGVVTDYVIPGAIVLAIVALIVVLIVFMNKQKSPESKGSDAGKETGAAQKADDSSNSNVKYVPASKAEDLNSYIVVSDATGNVEINEEDVKTLISLIVLYPELLDLVRNYKGLKSEMNSLNLKLEAVKGMVKVAQEPQVQVVEKVVEKIVEVPVAAKPVEQPKPVEAAKPIEEQKPVEEPKIVEQPKPVEVAKPVEQPKPVVKKAAPKKVEKRDVGEVDSYMPRIDDGVEDYRRQYRITQRPDGKYEIKFLNGKRAIKLYKNRKAAIARAEKLAPRHGGSLYVHKDIKTDDVEAIEPKND